MSPKEPSVPKATQPDSNETLHDQKLRTAPELPGSVAKQYGLEHPAVPVETKPTVPADEPQSETNSLVDSAETDQAVDDILAKESDQLLEAQSPAPPVAVTSKGFTSRLKGFFKAWWRNKVARYSTLGLLFFGVIAAAVVPMARYTVLNMIGVRSSASIIILDETTQLPLKNVAVSIGSSHVETNREGVAKFRDLKLGPTTLTVSRLAFAPYARKITIGWGSNPLGKQLLKAVGAQYTVEVLDYLSGKPIANAEVESNGINALSDATGKITLTVEDVVAAELHMIVKAPDYRSESVTVTAANNIPAKVTLVPAQKTVFVTKQSGTYDVYTADIDGKNSKMILKGSGKETSNLSLVVSADNSLAALVSTREGLRNKDGYMLNSLTLIRLNEGTYSTVDRAEQIQPVAWLQNKLIYRSTIADASAANAARNRLIAYNFDSNSKLQLASANQFNVIQSVKGSLYFAPSSTDPKADVGLFRVKADGSGREKLFGQEVWTGIRNATTTLGLQTAEGWYDLDVDSKQITKVSMPTNTGGMLFTESVDDKKSAWIETQDGKGVLQVKDNGSSKVTALASHSGLTYPIRWLSTNILVYRVATASEIADYVVSTQGGSPRKITDVSAVYGFNQAY